MNSIQGIIDPGIAPVVELLRSNGINTFSSCEGGPGHDFAHPTIRVEPTDIYCMWKEIPDIAAALSKAGYSGYYINLIHSFQKAPVLWDGSRANFIEIEFWEYPLSHPPFA